MSKLLIFRGDVFNQKISLGKFKKTYPWFQGSITNSEYIKKKRLYGNQNL